MTTAAAAHSSGRYRRYLRSLALSVCCLGFLRVALISAAPAAAENARWDFLVTNLDVFPGTGQFFEPDEKLFWRLKKNLREVKASEKLPAIEFPFTVSTNAEGRRVVPGNPGSSDTRSGKTVLFLGDSCTFGIPVNDDETFPARTKAKLAGGAAIEIHAVNAGVPGYSVFQGRLLLEQFTAPPDIVVVTFWPNGRSIWDHLSDAEHVELLAAERRGEFNTLRLTRLWRRATPGNRQRLNDEEFAGQLRLIAAWCRENGSTAVFQVWPTQRQTTEAAEVDRQQIIRRVGREEKVTVVDLVPTFRSAGDPGLFVDNIHCTRQGYDLAATALSDALAGLLRK